MFIKSTLLFGTVLAVVLSVISCKKRTPQPCNCNPDQLTTSESVFSTGFNNPRGLKFGPDGYLYVAEGGVGGSNPAGCTAIAPPVGPYTGSDTGACISRVSPSGERKVWINDLPSCQTSPSNGNTPSGVGDVAFIGNTLYGVLAGAGCSHGVPDIPNAVVRANPDRSWSIVADLQLFQETHPVAHPDTADFDPDGVWYSMASVNGDLYALEPNHGELDRITSKGEVSRVVDISASQGHIVPTAVVFYNGNFYVGNLGLFPITQGSSKILKITPAGKISVYATGFTTIVGITFDEQGGMYVLENTVGDLFPTPSAGDIVRIDPSGARATITTGLTLPTALTYGPDDNLYVSNMGFGAPAGSGEILKIDVTCAKQKSRQQL